MTNSNQNSNYRYDIGESWELKEEYPSHTYRVEIPNIIEEVLTDPYEFRLYAHIKRRAGDSGQCYESIKSIAKACGMSERKVQYTKEALAKPRKELEDLPLIRVRARTKENGEPDTDLITIVDMWGVNRNNFYFQKEIKGGAPHAPGVVHDMHQGGAPGAPKEEPYKEKQLASSSLASPLSTSQSDVDKTLVKRIKLFDSLSLNPGQKKSLANYAYDDIVKALDHMRRSKEDITNPYGWLRDCLTKRYWEDQPQGLAPTTPKSATPLLPIKYWIAFYNALVELFNKHRAFDEVVPGKDFFHIKGLGVDIFFERQKMKSEDDMLKYIKILNQYFTNKGLNLTLRCEKIGEEKDPKFHIEVL